MQPRAPQLLLSIVVADPWGGGAQSVTLRHLRDLRLALPFEAIAVVASGDRPGVAALQCEFPLVTIVQAEGTSAWTRGCEVARGRYVLLLDGTSQIDRALIEGMIQHMEKGPWVAAVGPRLVGPGGHERASGLAFPTPKSALALFRRGQALPEDLAPRLPNRFDRQVTTPKEVDAIALGCCMIKRQAFQEVGGWDAGYLAGGEALDWCQRARRKGWSSFYHPGLVARLAAEEDDDPRLLAARLASACRYIARYRGFAALCALKVLLALLSLHGILLEGGASLIPGKHRPDARSAFRRARVVLGSLIAPRHWLPARAG